MDIPATESECNTKVAAAQGQSAHSINSITQKLAGQDDLQSHNVGPLNNNLYRCTRLNQVEDAEVCVCVCVCVPQPRVALLSIEKVMHTLGGLGIE